MLLVLFNAPTTYAAAFLGRLVEDDLKPRLLTLLWSLCSS